MDEQAYYKLQGTRSGDKLRRKGATAGMTAFDLTKLFGRKEMQKMLQVAPDGGPPLGHLGQLLPVCAWPG